MTQQQTEDKNFYYDTNGNLVFTEFFLLNRGYCCGNGCRHCPYNYENVPEPKRSKLLEKKQPSFYYVCKHTN